MTVAPRALLVLFFALAACRGGVKAGLARKPESPPAPAVAKVPAQRIEYYKISDG